MKTLAKGTTEKLLAAREAANATSVAVPARIESHAEAAKVLAGGHGDRRKLANNTYLVRRERDEIAVMLHDTDVVTYYHDGTIIFSSGGWRTPTTMERINSYSPAEVTQQQGVWLIGIPGLSDDMRVTFADGIQLVEREVEGGHTTEYEWRNTGPSLEAQVELREQIKRYVEAFMEKFDADEIPAPSNGDCWHCLFGSGDNAAAFGTSADHIVLHMRDDYFVPSMVAAAVKRYPVSDVTRTYLRAKFHGGAGTLLPTHTERVGRAQVKSSLNKYIQAQFGLVGK